MNSINFSESEKIEKNPKNKYTFVRTLQKQENKNDKETPKGQDQIVLSCSLLLFENDISIKIEEVQDSLNTNTTHYEKNFTFEELRKISEFFTFTKKILLQKKKKI